MKKNRTIDYQLFTVTGLLLAFGLIMLYSASTVSSFKVFGNNTHYILHQLLFGAGLGLVAMFICYKIDYRQWQKYVPLMVIITLAALAVVKIGGLGLGFKGADRWINIGSLTFQPSELAKLVIIFYIAAWVEKKHRTLNDFYYGLLPSLCIVGLFAALILWQPDFGTMLVLIAVAFSMLFVAGIQWKYFFWTAVCGVLGLYLFIRIELYRAQRLTTFFNRAVDPQGISYQINQAMLAIGAGGLWGYGYGLSRQKHNYLPEAMSDSIFAVTAEELGFFRILLLFTLFGWFAYRGFLAAKNAPDAFGRMLAFGITSWIVFQALINIGAMVGLLPLTGIPLPFFSYGSTALILNLAAVGVLLNISAAGGYQSKTR